MLILTCPRRRRLRPHRAHCFRRTPPSLRPLSPPPPPPLLDLRTTTCHGLTLDASRLLSVLATLSRGRGWLILTFTVWRLSTMIQLSVLFRLTMKALALDSLFGLSMPRLTRTQIRPTPRTLAALWSPIPKPRHPRLRVSRSRTCPQLFFLGVAVSVSLSVLTFWLDKL